MNTGHALDAGDLVEQQVLIRIHVTDDHLQLVIGLLASDQQAFEHFRNFHDARLELGETFRSVQIHRDSDQGHQCQAEFPGIKKRPVADDQSGFLERAYPAQAGGGRQANTVGQILIADPPFLLQDGENLPVVTVHGY